MQNEQIHNPCLARAAVTSSARVASWGDSSRLMLPEDETLLSLRGEAMLDLPGDCVMISAPWSTRALACSLKFSFWLSICSRKRKNFTHYMLTKLCRYRSSFGHHFAYFKKLLEGSKLLCSLENCIFTLFNSYSCTMLPSLTISTSDGCFKEKFLGVQIS